MDGCKIMSGVLWTVGCSYLPGLRIQENRNSKLKGNLKKGERNILFNIRIICIIDWWAHIQELGGVVIVAGY